MAHLLLVSAASEENAFLEAVKTVNKAVGDVVGGWPALILLLFVGLLMSVLTKFFQISHIGRWLKCTIGAIFRDKSVTKHTGDNQISQFQSICAALASTVGTVLAVLFAVFCLFASFGIGNMTQINTIAVNMESTFGIPGFVTGIVLTVVAALVVIGGIKRIASVTEKIVPLMVVLYLVGTLAVCFMHIDQFGAVFGSIFTSAFGLQAAAGGVVGFGVKCAMEYGMKRGVFSNEAGLGSSVMVHCNSNVKEPVSQGMWGIFSVFVDTIVVCTLTAFTVLSSGYIDLESGKLADESITNTGSLVGLAFEANFGVWGRYFIAVALLLFAFSTVLGWSHYGTKACEYLFGVRSTIVYRLIFVVAIMGGATMGENLAWELSDTFNGMMMIPNLIGLLVLSPLVCKCTKNYIDRHVRHMDVEPMLSMHEKIQREQALALAAEERELEEAGISKDLAE